MLLQAGQRGVVDSIEAGQQPIGPTARPSPLARNVFGAEMQAGEMVGGKTLLAQQCGNKQRPEPGAMLQHLNVGPGLEQDRRSQDDWQIARPGDHVLPFGQPFFFVPVEIVDQAVLRLRPVTSRRFFISSRHVGAAPNLRRACQDSIDLGKFLGQQIVLNAIANVGFKRAGSSPLPVSASLARRRRHDAAAAGQRQKTVAVERPVWRLRRNPPAGSKHRVRASQLVGRGGFAHPGWRGSARRAPLPHFSLTAKCHRVRPSSSAVFRKHSARRTSEGFSDVPNVCSMTAFNPNVVLASGSFWYSGAATPCPRWAHC